MVDDSMVDDSMVDDSMVEQIICSSLKAYTRSDTIGIYSVDKYVHQYICRTLPASKMAVHSLAEARAILKNLALSFNENFALPSAIFKGIDKGKEIIERCCRAKPDERPWPVELPAFLL